MKTSKLILLLTCFFALSLFGCKNKDDVRINGTFYGINDRMVYLSELAPSGRETTIDSVRTDSKGKFEFKLKLKDTNPSFINIKVGNNNRVPLLVAPGEDIKLESIGNIFINYTVEGSHGSELIKNLNGYSIQTMQKLDSLNTLFNNETDYARIQELGTEYSKTYIALKRNAIDFMVRNSSSLAAVVPLYQPTFQQQYLFNSPEDIAYYRMVSTALRNKYPTSPYVQSLRNDIERINNKFKRDSMISASLLEPRANNIEIVMADARGKMRKLSELKGQVVLIDFTNTSDLKAKALNRELMNTYAWAHKKGFEVFQISVEPSKSKWINSVIDAKTPWISVNDLHGVNSPSLKSYNIKSLPSNFLLDREGNIVGKNIYGEDLNDRLNEMLNSSSKAEDSQE